MQPLNQVAQWHDVDEEIFRTQIQPLAQPAILKGVVKDWPIVQAAKQSSEQLFSYLTNDYKGGKARFISQAATEDGYYFYNDTFTGFNFERKIAPLDTVFKLMEVRSQDSSADRIAIQSAPVSEYFHKIAQQNVLSLMPSDVEPRFWLGNDACVTSHYDDSENIACVVAGKRVFTLFPPEQINNLYIGPLENTPGGAPVSMVKLNDPDFERFPKFKVALKYALQAELEPGDAIYIPTLWWHHVEAKSSVNMLINYWQGGSISGLEHPSGLDLVLMGLISIKKLPEAQRQSWMNIFSHLVMSDAEEFDYIPEQIRGVLGKVGTDNERNIYQWLEKVIASNK